MGGLFGLLPRSLVHAAPHRPRCQSVAGDTGVRHPPRRECPATGSALAGSPVPSSVAAFQAVSQPRADVALATARAEALVCTMSCRARRAERRGLRGPRLERRAETLRGTDSLTAESPGGRSQLDGPRGGGTSALHGLPLGLPCVPRARGPQDAGSLE